VTMEMRTNRFMRARRTGCPGRRRGGLMACKAGKKGVAGVKTQAAQASDRVRI